MFLQIKTHETTQYFLFVFACSIEDDFTSALLSSQTLCSESGPKQGSSSKKKACAFEFHLHF